MVIKIQTFMPYSNFQQVAKCLDMRRLGKQRVEAWQIYQALTNKDYGWQNHPIVKMWRGYEKGICFYGEEMCKEWIRRGYKDTLLSKFQAVLNNPKAYSLRLISYKDYVDVPDWCDDKELQLSHQSNLVRKMPEHYRKYFPDVPDNIPYKWVV